ncbi:MAG TPA: efflux RND transporter periplasmic adaptor subunit [Thermoanaerobaculia bacterium]|nr:efflux RND transporter periplasmic adaptor subunit [Thermoanaerobaculia bacterium]
MSGTSPQGRHQPGGAALAPTGAARRGRRSAAGFVAPGAALVLAALGWAVATRVAPARGEWVEVRRDDLVQGVSVSGALAAVDSAFLGPPPVADLWTYKITFLAPEGAVVRRGDRVLAFDPSELDNTLRDKTAERDSAEKSLEEKRAALDLARRDAELELAQAEAHLRRAKLKVDVPAELVSRNDLQAARIDQQLAERELAYHRERLRLIAAQQSAELAALAGKRDRAAVRVAEAEAAIARMSVVSPRQGTVIHLADRQGVKKKVGDPCWPMEKVVEIPDLRRMKAQGEVDEADLGRIAVGQAVALRLDAHPDVAFEGRVRAIGGAVQSRSAVNPQKVVKLELELSRTDPLRMRPGMRFLGTVEVARVRGVLVAPLEAVLHRPDGPLVFRRGRFGVDVVRPRLGRRNDRLVEVLGGLGAGDLLRCPAAGSAGPGFAAAAAGASRSPSRPGGAAP